MNSIVNFSKVIICGIEICLLVVLLFAYPLNMDAYGRDEDIKKQNDALDNMSFEELMMVKITTAENPKWNYSRAWSLIMLKLIGLDRHFSRFGNPVKIGIDSEAILAELNALKGKVTINKTRFVPVEVNSVKSASGFKILYIGRDSSLNTDEALNQLSQNGILIFCENTNNVLFGGSAVLFKENNRNTDVIININNAEAQGTDIPEEELPDVFILKKQ